MQDLTIALVQARLIWEDPGRNLQQFDHTLEQIGRTAQLVVLPEMFNTGFTMDTERNAETMDGPTVIWMKQKAKAFDCVLAGSILVKEKDRYYNRFVWMPPDGTPKSYDKRHRFTMAGEHKVMEAGKSTTIVTLKDWKINLQVCYDLRFPVWSKNTCREDTYGYDVLVYVANWPEIRKQAYQRLLPARAIENMAYVVWVNRIGEDNNGKAHSGDSAIYDPEGNMLISAGSNVEQVVFYTLSSERLKKYRDKFNFGPDWDRYKILE